MAEQKIRLSPTQADDLSAVCASGADVLLHIAAAIEALPPTMEKGKIQQAISSVAGSENAERLRRVLIGLATVHRRNFEDASTLLESVSIPANWTPQQVRSWDECKPVLKRLLSAQPIVLTTKAADLSFDVERFCVGARIITDIRPVFDELRQSIVGSTIRQTMRMEYMSIDGTLTSISVGLDANDIKRIRRSCDDAIRKADVSRDLLIKAGLSEILMPGEEVNE